MVYTVLLNAVKFVHLAAVLLIFYSLTYQELQLDEFVTHEVGFEDINKAFDLLIEGQSLRCVIWMNK